MKHGTLSHFAIHADDPERASAFYRAVFDWKITPWGPPGFLQIQGDDGVPRGAIQSRRALDDRAITGFECTIAVDDLEETKARVLDKGGRVVMDRSAIRGVGELMFFADTEDNIFGAMRYDATVTV